MCSMFFFHDKVETDEKGEKVVEWSVDKWILG
jgi:hypothetical protein